MSNIFFQLNTTLVQNNRRINILFCSEKNLFFLQLNTTLVQHNWSINNFSLAMEKLSFLEFYPQGKLLFIFSLIH